MKVKFDREKLSGVLETLRQQLVIEVKAEDIGTHSMTPLKAMTAREALLWRIVELADGGIVCLDAGNYLSAIILIRASIECVAVQHQLNNTIRIAPTREASAVDADVLKLLMGTRFFSTGDIAEDNTIQMTNIQTCLNRLDKAFSGARADYEYLCEYAHPNWAGTAGLFTSGNPTKGIIRLGKYTKTSEHDLHAYATSILTSTLLMFSADYISIADDLAQFFEACDRRS